MADDVSLKLITDATDLFKTLQQYRQELQDLKDQNASLNKEIQARTDAAATSEKSVVSFMSNTSKELDNQKQLYSDLRKFLDDQAKAGGKAFDSKVVDSYNQQLKKSADLVKQLTTAGKTGILSPDEVKQLTAALNNTSNEFEALNVIIDVTKKKLASLNPDSQEFKQLSADIQGVEQMLSSMNTETENTDSKQKSLKQTFRDNIQALAEMKVNGQENTAQFIALREATGQLYDTLHDTREEVSSLGSDTRGIDHVIRSAQLMTASFQIAQGAAALLGSDDQELQEALLKVNAAMSILNGLQAIGTELTKKDSLVRSGLIAVQKFYTAAVNETNVALGFMKLALLATGIGAFIVLIGGIAQAMDLFKSKTSEATKELEKQNIALTANRDIVNAEIDGYKTQSDVYISELQKQGASSKAIREQQVKDLDGEIAIRKELADRAIANINKYGEIEKKIRAGSKELTEDDLKAYSDALKLKDDASDAYSKAQSQRQILTNQNAIALRNVDVQEAAAANAAKLAGTIAGSAAELKTRKEAIEIQRDTELRNVDLTESEKVSIRQKADNEIKKLDKDYLKSRQEFSNQLQDFIKHDEDVRVAAIKDGYAKQQAETLNNFDNEITQLDRAYKQIIATQLLSTEQRKKLDASYHQQQLDIAAKYSVQLLKIDNDNNDKLIQAKLKTDEVLGALSMDNRSFEIETAKEKYRQLEKELQDDGLLTAELHKKIQDALAKDTKQIDLKYNQDTLDRQEQLEIAKVNILTSDKYSPALLEEIKQQKVLEVQLKYAKLKLAALEAAGGKENQVAIAQQKALVASLQKQTKEATAKNSPISEALGITDDQLKDVIANTQKTVDSVLDALAAGLQAKIQLTQQAIDDDNTRVDAAQTALDKELQLQKQGYANNVASKQAELDALKAQQAKDVAQQKEYQKQLAQVEEAKQIAALATSVAYLTQTVAKIFQSSTEDFGWYGAIAAIAEAAAVVGQFFALKSSIKANQSLGEGGEVGGNYHSNGGNKYISMDGNDPNIVEIEKDEFVVRRAAYKKNPALVRAFNDNPDVFSGWSIDATGRLIQPTDISYNARPGYAVLNNLNFIASPDSKTDDNSNDYLKRIADSNEELLDKENQKKEVHEYPDRTVIIQGNHTRIIHKNKT